MPIIRNLETFPKLLSSAQATKVRIITNRLIDAILIIALPISFIIESFKLLKTLNLRIFLDTPCILYPS